MKKHVTYLAISLSISMGLVSRHSEHLRTLMVLSLQHFSATSTSSCYSQMETRAMKALIFPFHFIRSPNSLLKHTRALKGVLLLTPSFAVPQSDGSVCKTASDQCKLQPMSSASTPMPQSRSFSCLFPPCLAQQILLPQAYP